MKILDICYHIKIYSCLILIVCVSIAAQAQTVSGIILDSNNREPVVGASVILKGTSTGTTTDFNGTFKINSVTRPAVLEISYLGYKNQTIDIDAKNYYEILLIEDVQVLDQVVVIGYGTQKKSDLLGAVASVKSEEIVKMPTTNVLQALQGKAAGVEIVQNSGAPGSSTSIRIRGIGTINNSDPLYVVDGISMTNIDYLSSEDIASVEILKDAASAAIYGSRAANGVVLITTKDGKKGDKGLLVNFSSSIGRQEVWKKPSMMDKSEYIYFSDYVLNQYVKTDIDTDGNLFVKDEFKQMLEKGSNWWDLTIRKAFMQKYNLSVSGGDSKLNYYLSANVQKTDGVVLRSGYDKKALNAKVNAQLTKKVSLGSTITYALENKQVVNEGTWGIIKTSINYNPLTPIYDINGSYSWTSPVENLRRTSYDAPTKSLIGQLTLDWDIIKDLRFSSRASYTSFLSDKEAFSIYNTNPEIVARIRFDVSRNPVSTENVAFDNILTFTKSIRDHDFSVMVGQTLETSASTTTTASATGFGGYSQYYDALNLATRTQQVSGWSGGWNALSFLGRINYSYKSKYLFQSNFRADGSSRFTKTNRWGYFPSFSAGWKINGESFLEDVHVITLLKLRAGWGQLGNNRIGNQAYLTTVGGSGEYIYGSGIPEIVPAFSVTSFGNENIRWERTETTNVGLDFNLFNNRFTSSIDVFKKRTRDMLIAVPIVYSSGYSSVPLQNAGNVDNSGYEVQLSYRDGIGKFKYEVNGNFTQVKNTVASLGTSNEPILGGNLTGPNNLGYVNRTVINVPIAVFYGYKTDGIMQPGDFDSNGKPLVPVFSSSTPFKTGDMKFVDINRDNKIDENDKTFLGSPHPAFYYGFNINLEYAGFDLQCFFQGIFGNQLYNVMKYFQYSAVDYNGAWNLAGSNYSNVAKDYFDKVYRPEINPNLPAYRDNWGANVNGVVPAPNSDASRNSVNFINSDFYIEDGSYLRLKNIQMGYNFKNDWVRKIHLKKLRVYVSATNLLTFTNYSGLDPEVGKRIGTEANNLFLGIDEGTYPQARTYLAGLIIDL